MRGRKVDGRHCKLLHGVRRCVAHCAVRTRWTQNLETTSWFTKGIRTSSVRPPRIHLSPPPLTPLAMPLNACARLCVISVLPSTHVCAHYFNTCARIRVRTWNWEHLCVSVDLTASPLSCARTSPDPTDHTCEHTEQTPINDCLCVSTCISVCA